MRNKKLAQRIVIVLILFCILILLINIIKITFSRYESTATSNSNIPVAFYVLNDDFQTMSLKLDSIVPSSNPYIYNFTISNSNGEEICDTDMEYTLKIRTTTNLPLEYSLYMNQSNNNIIQQDKIEKDENGTYFRILEIPKENFTYKEEKTNKYQLIVKFDEKYNTIDYQDIIERIEIIVDSKQIIE